MDMQLLLHGLMPKNFATLTVDDTAGGVGFAAAQLSWEGLRAQLVRVNVEDGGEIRYREDGGEVTADWGYGDLRGPGDEFFVFGAEAIAKFRAIRTGADNGKLNYQPYF